MAAEHLETGCSGEALACKFIENLGMTILERNWATRFSEIDIIAKDDDTVCFIEVKTRTSVKKALPRQAVNYRKQQKLIMGAEAFLKKHRLTDTRARFDVIEIIFQEPVVINHLKHAFQRG